MQGDYFNCCQFLANEKRGKEEERAHHFCSQSTGQNLATRARLKNRVSIWAAMYPTENQRFLSVTQRGGKWILETILSLYIIYIQPRI